MIRTLRGLKRRVRFLIELEKKALADDDPQGTCAAHHRGQIHAFRMILREIGTAVEQAELDKEEQR